VKVYINGTRVTDFAVDADIAQNENMVCGINGDTLYIGSIAGSTYFGGYLAEFIFVDGTAPGIGNFGEFDSNGVWIPVDPSGLTFGTNGFWLDFAVAPGTGNGAGTDVSGEANHFTDSGLAANDQMSDSPSDDATADPVVGNYAVLNSVYESSTYVPAVISDGNLTAIDTDAARHAISTIALPSTGKWAFKVTYNSGTWFSMGLINGINFPTNASSPHASADADALSQNASAITLYDDGSSHATGITKLSGGQNCECLVDMDADTVKFYTQGSVVGTTITGVAATIAPSFYVYVESANVTVDFGQSGYTPSDSSYKTLCTANLPAPAIEDPSAHFQTTLYTGNATGSRAITQTGNSQFGPDLVVIKNRDQTDEWKVLDRIRGATEEWNFDGSAAWSTDANGLTAFSATDGFTLGTGAGGYNDNAEAFVAYQWKGDGTTGATNDDGSIDSTVNVNTTAGISIIRWNGTGANGTIGHGLTTAPSFLITKADAGENSIVWHIGIAATEYLYLTTNAAKATDAAYWNSTAPSATVISLGSNPGSNKSGTANMICYAFEEIESFSKFGSFVGNGSDDGPVMYCGFRPAWFMWKSVSTATNGEWTIIDAARDPYNQAAANFRADTTMKDDTGEAKVDFCANGVKHRGGSSQRFNADGVTYMFAAFAENPFGGSGVAQARAR
jgi:hypothetical protein